MMRLAARSLSAPALRAILSKARAAALGIARAAALGIALAVALGMGCERRATPAAPAVSPPDAATLSAKPALADAGSIPNTNAPAKLDEAALQAFLSRWLETQNRGKYADYAALYASKFLGVKRAGQREKRFAREGWLEDRQRMFQKPITVEALSAKFHAGVSSAEIDFTQRFATGSFADEGPKRLLVVREAGALKIAHEEMLASHQTSAPNPSLNSAFDLQLVLGLETGLYLVFEPEVELVSRAPAQLENQPDQPDVWNTTRALRDAEVEPALRALKGKRMRLDTGCVAQVERFVLLSRVDPHFGTEQAWDNRFEDQPNGALTPQQTAEAAFELGERFVAAKLAGCSEGSYAQREESAAPVLAERVEDAALTARARAAFAKLPDVVADQKSFLSDVEGARGKWWEPSLKLEIYRHPVSRQTLVSVSADLIGDGCSDFSAKQWAVFELRGKQLVALRTSSVDGTLSEVLDVNGDGRLEFLLRGGSFDTDARLLSPDPSGPETQLHFSYQDCPC